MKTFLIFILFIFFPSITISHPGKTDRRGGHKCWKDCYEWELSYGEYHLHDKDFKPIRLGRDANPKKPKEPPEIVHSVTPQTPQALIPEVIQKELPKEIPREVPAQQARSETTMQEDFCPIDSLHVALSAALLVLLLALLAMRIKGRKARH